MAEDRLQQQDMEQEAQGDDDGSLAFLRIPRDKNSKSFNCEETTQSKLVNTKFWVHDFIDKVETKFSKQKGSQGQHLVLISKDSDLLWLIDEIIDSTDGLPIGNYLSQYLSNLYLAYFMHYVNETLRVKATEYADDIVFYSDSKEELHHTLEKVREYLRTELHLELKGNEQIFPMAVSKYDPYGRALDYVGYTFHREQRGMRKSIKKHFCKRLAKLNTYHLSVRRYKRKVSAWLGWAKYSDSKHLLQTIIRKDYYDSIFINQARCA